MRKLDINIRDKEDVVGRVRVSLDFDVPEDLMTDLGNRFSDAFERWEDSVVLHERLMDRP